MLFDYFYMEFIFYIVQEICFQIVICNTYVKCVLCLVTGGLLCQDPEARFSLEQIYNSSWLQNVNLNSVSIAKAHDWSMTPRDPADATTLIEKTARERLLKLGITENMLQEDKDKGSKSSAIATYRMVVHRLENNAAYPQPAVTQTIKKTQKPAKSRLCRIL